MTNKNVLINPAGENAVICNHYGINQHLGAVEPRLPIYACTPVIGDSVLQVTNQASMKDESGLSHGIQRNWPKNHRQSCAPPRALQKVESFSHSQSNNLAGSSSIIDENFPVQIPQVDLDRLNYQHMENVRIEIEEKLKANWRRIVKARRERILQRLKSKDEEIDKVVKMNGALEERLMSLALENHLLGKLAQTNEATANALRADLARVLAQVSEMQALETAAGIHMNNLDDDDDAESCCGSSSPDGGVYGYGRMMCRNCGMADACVLMLTCRHISLCARCGSGRTTCPVCDSVNSASLYVNLW